MQVDIEIEESRYLFSNLERSYGTEDLDEESSIPTLQTLCARALLHNRAELHNLLALSKNRISLIKHLREAINYDLVRIEHSVSGKKISTELAKIHYDAFRQKALECLSTDFLGLDKKFLELKDIILDIENSNTNSLKKCWHTTWIRLLLIGAFLIMSPVLYAVAIKVLRAPYEKWVYGDYYPGFTCFDGICMCAQPHFFPQLNATLKNLANEANNFNMTQQGLAYLAAGFGGIAVRSSLDYLDDKYFLGKRLELQDLSYSQGINIKRFMSFLVKNIILLLDLISIPIAVLLFINLPVFRLTVNNFWQLAPCHIEFCSGNKAYCISSGAPIALAKQFNHTKLLDLKAPFAIGFLLYSLFVFLKKLVNTDRKALWQSSLNFFKASSAYGIKNVEATTELQSNFSIGSVL